MGVDKDLRDSRIPTRRFNQRIPWFYPSASLRLLDHAQGYAVLDTAAGIEELDLGVDGALYAEGLGYAVQADEGGVADGLGDG